MPRLLREKMALLTGASMAVVSLAFVFRRGTTMPDLSTKLTAITLIWCVLLLLQWILAPKRRHSEHWLVQYGAMAGYYLPFPLAVYAANSVRYSDGTSTDHVAWCTLLVVLSQPVLPWMFTMSAYTFGDSPFRNFSTLKSVFYFCLLLSIVISQPLDDAMLVLMHLVFHGDLARKWSHISSDHRCDAKARADRVKAMVNSQLSPSSNGDASSSQTYRPWVEFIGVGSMISNGVGDISHQNIKDKEDISLSNVFFKLLTRRCFGFHCAEEGNAMVRDFMLEGLLQPDFKRAFTIVEAQLALLHQYCFSTQQFLLLQEMYLTLYGFLFLFFLVLIILLQQTFHHLPYYPAVLLLPLLIYVPLGRTFLEIRRCAGDAVRTDNTYPSSNAWFSQPYWKNEIGQYSLLEDYDQHSVKKIALVTIKAFISSEWPPRFVSHHPVEQDPIPLLDSVRELVASTLRDINGPPTNGIMSLQRNRGRIVDALARAGSTIVDDFSWTCNEHKSHAHTILIWHIATCYCELQQEEEDTNCYQVAATALSRYCAYLVAFLPEFLPEHILTTQMVFQGVLTEAKAAMPTDEDAGTTQQDLSPTDKKRTKITGLRLREDEARLTTFEKGVKLGRRLEQLDTLLRWKVMAEFWAETILYIAPSDNAALHVERLAKGGEFVTHLWAMLSNAGILKRAN